MNIQIITTERKLTKQILNQMFQLHYEIFDDIEILGYLVVNKKSTNTEVLVYSNIKKDYYLLNMLWEQRGNYAGYNYGKYHGEYQKQFRTISINDWFEKYNKIIKEANKKGHIYI